MKIEILDRIMSAPSTDADASFSEDVVEMAPQIIHLKNILVPLDFSETSMKALQYAVPFAKQFGSKLTLLHVAELPGYTPELPTPGPLDPEHQEALRKRLAEIRVKHIPADVSVDLEVRHNFAFEGILDVARDIRADLIITSTHGFTGLKHVFMGSTAEHVVRKAPCPVLVVRQTEHDFV